MQPCRRTIGFPFNMPFDFLDNSMEKRRIKFNLIALTTFVVMVFLIVEVILLLKQNRDLRALCSKLPEGILSVGESVEGFALKSLDDKNITVEYNDPNKSFLFFILSPGCGHCERNLPIWNLIASHNVGDRIDVLGICLSGAEDARRYVSDNHPSFNVLIGDTSFTRKYKVVGTPETMEIRGDGLVQAVFVGELNESQTNQILTFFNAETH